MKEWRIVTDGKEFFVEHRRRFGLISFGWWRQTEMVDYIDAVGYHDLVFKTQDDAELWIKDQQPKKYEVVCLWRL